MGSRLKRFSFMILRKCSELSMRSAMHCYILRRTSTTMSRRCGCEVDQTQMKESCNGHSPDLRPVETYEDTAPDKCSISSRISFKLTVRLLTSSNFRLLRASSINASRIASCSRSGCILCAMTVSGSDTGVFVAPFLAAALGRFLCFPKA